MSKENQLTDNQHNDMNDMVQFQKGLDQQFLEIYELRKQGKSDIDHDVHGLVERLGAFRIFLPLNELKSIGSEIKYETLPLMASWVIGYNQMQGELFTIVDLENIMETTLDKSFVGNKREIELDDNIIYIRDKSVASVAIVTKTLNMKFSAEFKELISWNKEDNGDSDGDNALFYWSINTEHNYWEEFKKDNMTDKEWLLVNDFYDIAKKSKKLNLSDWVEEANNESLTGSQRFIFSLVENLYIDEWGKNPILSINCKKFIKYLLKLKAF